MDWWTSLQLAEQFFYVIALVSTLILSAQLVMNLIGLGMDDVDMDGFADADVPDEFEVDHPDLDAHSSGLGMLSIKTVTAFMVGFGWAGVAALYLDLPIAVAVLAAAVTGGLFMLMVFALMKAIYRLADSGTVDVRNAAGCSGTVYLPVPPRRKGVGQVQVTVQNRMRELPAISDEHEILATGTPVKVVKVLDGGTVLIQRMEAGNE